MLVGFRDARVWTKLLLDVKLTAAQLMLSQLVVVGLRCPAFLTSCISAIMIPRYSDPGVVAVD